MEIEPEIKRFRELASIPDDYVTLIKERLYSKTLLDADSIYHFCPLCVQRIRRGLQEDVDWKTEAKKELDPLTNELWKCLYRYSLDNTQGIVLFENRLKCKVCRKEITTKDFEEAYTDEPSYLKHSKLINLNDQEALNRF